MSVASAKSGGSGGGGGAVSSVFGRTGAVVAANNDYTSGQLAAGANTNTGTFSFSQAGAFAAGTMNDYFQDIVTGGLSGAVCNPQSIINGGGSTFQFTDAVTGIVCLPSGSTGVTNGYSNGVLGAAWVDNSGAGGQFGWVGGVGVSGQGWCVANNAHCWGMNAGVSDAASQSGNVEIANELDVTVNNSNTTGFADLASFRGNGQPTADTFPAFAIQAPAGTGSFTSGFECQTGSVLGPNSPCLNMAPSLAGASKNSHSILFNATNGSSAIVTYKLFSTVDGFGNPELTTASALNTMQVGKLNIAATFTVSTLPSASTAGAGTVVVVSDAAPSAAGACVGSGSIEAVAISNGTTWACNGVGTPTLTLKKGSGGGNYTNSTTSYTVADSTNLCYTVTIPTGWKLSINASGALGTATAIVVASAALTDNASCSTANAGILVETQAEAGAIAGATGFALNWVITGNAAAHNIALQFKTANASDSASLINSSATLTPTMVFNLTPSN
jgi:hypothetical protein